MVEMAGQYRRIAVLGVGNPLRMDDAAGMKVIDILETLQHPEGIEFLLYRGEMAPENFAPAIVRDRPDVVIIVDAAIMSLQPGEYRIIPEDSIVVDQISTHSMPPRILIEYLRENLGHDMIFLIGINPGRIDFGTEISPEVMKGVESLARKINNLEFESIPVLEE